MNDKAYPIMDDISLIKSGIFYKFASRLRLDGSSTKHIAKRILLLIGITWLPLLVLTALQGLAFGNKVDIPFLKDFATHAKFLLILPLLLFAEGTFDFRLKELTIQFFRSGILNENDLGSFELIKKRVKCLTDSIWPEIIMFILIIINVILRVFSAGVNKITIWLFLPDNLTSSISWAGLYFTIISITFFQFIILRWLWHWIIWFIYFRKLAKMPLKLNSAHPDLAGGLGFLGFPPGPFIQVLFALAILFSAVIAENLYFLHQKLQTYYPHMAVFVILSILMSVMPLMVFMKPLLVQRRNGYFDYSALIQEHHRQFDEKWLRKPYKEALPGISDASSMTDFNTSFDVVKNMKLFPFDIKIMVSSIIIAILPMLPLLAFEYNIADLILRVLKMLA
jgi:hypothetical protein